MPAVRRHGVLVAIDDGTGRKAAGELRHGIGRPDVARKEQREVCAAGGGQPEVEHSGGGGRVLGPFDPDALAGALQPRHGEEGGEGGLVGSLDDDGERPIGGRLLLECVERPNRLGRRFPGDDHHHVERLGRRLPHQWVVVAQLTALDPLGERARVLGDVGTEGGKDPVREEDPFHAGNLPDGAVRTGRVGAGERGPATMRRCRYPTAF